MKLLVMIKVRTHGALKMTKDFQTLYSIVSQIRA